MPYQLRCYQAQGVDQIRAAMQGGARAVLYVLPTGGGKTVVFSHVIDLARERGSRVLVLVHRRELLLQGSRALTENDIDHGLIAPGFSMTADPVQVGSVYTVPNRFEFMQEPDLIIIDEAHHTAAKSWAKVIERYPKARILGVTATPERLDGRGLGRNSGGVFDVMVQGPTTAELTEQGFLAPFDLYAPPTPFDVTGIRTVAGDYDKKEVRKRVDQPVITGCAVSHYRKTCDGRPAIAFCASVKHAENVAKQFRDAGYAFITVHGKMKERDRDMAMDALKEQRIHGITACDVISEGVDVPLAICGIMLRPTQSLGLCMQQMGRLLRPKPDGENAVFLDHVGNCYRHGLPDAVREWNLNAGKRPASKGKAENAAVRQCPQCFAVHRPAPKCPKCGFVYKVRTKQLKYKEGELVKMSSADRKEKRREIAHKIEAQQQGRRAALLRLAEQRGYNAGWVEHVLRAQEAKQREAVDA